MAHGVVRSVSWRCGVPHATTTAALRASPDSSPCMGSTHPWPPVRYPTRYRTLPHGPAELRRLPRRVRTRCSPAPPSSTPRNKPSPASWPTSAPKLAELRVVMWPRIDRKDIVHGFRRTRRGGPPPIPRVAPERAPALRANTCVRPRSRSWRANDRPMTLVEIHRELHLNGYAIASRDPVKRLADCLGYESDQGPRPTRRPRRLRARPAQPGARADESTASRLDASTPIDVRPG